MGGDLQKSLKIVDGATVPMKNQPTMDSQNQLLQKLQRRLVVGVSRRTTATKSQAAGAMHAHDQPVLHPKKMTIGARNLSKIKMNGGNQERQAPARGPMETIGHDQSAQLPVRVADGDKSLVATLVDGGALTIVEPRKIHGETMTDHTQSTPLLKMKTMDGVDLRPFHGNEEMLIVDHDHTLVHRAQEVEDHGLAISRKMTGEIKALTHGEIRTRVETKRTNGALLRTTINVLGLGKQNLPLSKKTPDGKKQILIQRAGETPLQKSPRQ